MKIQCHECGKPISVDEGFAGGTCHCPFCRAIVQVPEAASAEVVRRPEAPSSRPSSPAAVDAPAGKPPTRSAVRQKLHGLFVLVCLGVLVLIVVAFIVTMFSGGGADNGDTGRPQGQSRPLKVMGKHVAGIRLITPVVYCVDAGGSMGEHFDLAQLVVRHSVATLSEQDKFNVIVWHENGPEKMSDAWLAGGSAGEDRAALFLRTILPAGGTDEEDGLAAAVALEPKNIVVLARKEFGNLDAIVAACKKRGIAISTIALGAHPQGEKVMAALATDTGGASRTFDYGQLDELGALPSAKQADADVPEGQAPTQPAEPR